MTSIKTQPLANSPAARRGHTEAIVANLLEAGYRVVQTIGQGAAGTIFLGRDQSGELVAIKVLHPRLAGDAVPVKRFLRESGVCAQLKHPNLVRSLAAGERNGTYFMVMEYVPGETLGALFERRGKFPEDEAVQIIRSLASALKVVHDAQLVHRDVKPSNVLMTAEGAPKLGDLGLAKELVASDLTRPNQSLGTPIYMAPEQFFNAQQVDGRCDIYALGIMLYALTTGELPFPGPELGRILDNKVNGNYIPPERINPSLSPQTVEAIRRAIQARPEHRPADMAEFLALLPQAETNPKRVTVNVSVSPERSEPLISCPTVGRAEMLREMGRGPSGFPENKILEGRPTPPPSAEEIAKGSSTPLGSQAVSPTDLSAIDANAVDRWHLVLAKGRTLTLVQASAPSIIRAILKGKLQVNVCASRSERGPFIPIGMIPDIMKLLPPDQ
jgi:eukaryotic-like serine/threonine-protein kinase